MNDQEPWSRWREKAPAFIETDTGLTTALGPFQLDRVWEADNRWRLIDLRDGSTISEADGFFASYRAMLDAFEDWFQMLPGKRVYFIGESCQRGAMIKIGVASDPEVRLKMLQIGSPLKLQILALTGGGETIERSYHYRFRNVRSHGEWFVADDEIVAEIGRLNAAAVDGNK